VRDEEKASNCGFPGMSFDPYLGKLPLTLALVRYSRIQDALDISTGIVPKVYKAHHGAGSNEDCDEALNNSQNEHRGTGSNCNRSLVVEQRVTSARLK
jgi:hypothetical protein